MPLIFKARVIREIFGHDYLFEEEAKLNNQSNAQTNFFRDNAEPLGHDIDSTKYLLEFNQCMASILCSNIEATVMGDWKDIDICNLLEQCK